MVLLVAMIGAIVLTLRHKPGVKRQDIADQVARTPATGMRVVQIKSGEGPRGMTIGLAHYLAVAAILFTIGVFGIFVNRKNVIVILMSIELILLAVNINLVAFSVYLHDVAGPDLRHVRAHRGGRRGRRRPGHPGHLLPQPRRHRRGRRLDDEGLRPHGATLLVTIIVFGPLLGAPWPACSAAGSAMSPRWPSPPACCSCRPCSPGG